MSEAEVVLVPVRYEVLGIETVRGAGRLVALAVVVLEVEGVSLTLQGVQVVRDGESLTCRAPTFRHPRTGCAWPAVVLPPVVAAAVAAEVLDLLPEAISQG